MIYPKPLEDLVKQLQKLPTIGPKTAQRLAFSILKMSGEEVIKISKSLSDMLLVLFHIFSNHAQSTVLGNALYTEP